MSKSATIEKIYVYLTNNYDTDTRFKNAFKFETRMSAGKDWIICKDFFLVAPPIFPLEVRCDKPTTAKYLRVTGGSDPNRALNLLEVELFGIPSAYTASVPRGKKIFKAILQE